MAEYKGINLTANENGTVLDPGVWGGKVQLVRDSATFASIGANDVAYLGYLPKNARILPNSFIKYGAMGKIDTTKASFNIGTLGTSNKFGTVSDAEAAGSFTFTSSTVIGNDKVGEAGPVVVTIVTPGDATNVPVEAWIFYVQAG